MRGGIERIGRSLSPRIDRLAHKLSDDLLDTVATPVTVPREQLWISVWANLRAITGYLVAGGLPEEWAAPEDALEFARLCARRDIPESSLVMFYHRAHNLFELEILATVEDEIDFDGDTATPFEILGAVRAMTTDYMQGALPEIRTAYQDEIALRSSLGDPETLRLTLDVLNDSGGQPSSIAGHELSGGHVGAILRTPDRSPFDAFELEIISEELAGALGAARGPLTVQPSSHTVWLWFQADTVASPPPTDLSETVITSIGMLSHGVAGFRATHNRARACDRLGRTTDVGAGTTISDWSAGTVSASAFAEQPRKAIEVIDTVLGSLAAADEETRLLRDTARAYLVHGPSGAARQLVVHRNTIKYRIDRVRQLLGRDELASPDLVLALELARWFGRGTALDREPRDV